MRKWLVLYCKSNKLEMAKNNLEKQGFQIYRPRVKVLRKGISLGEKYRTEPLFPCYLFLNVDPEVQSIAPVRSTRGVVRFVTFGRQYATVSENTISEIRRNVEERNKVIELGKKLTPGSEIRVNGNGFNDVNAIFSSHVGKDRALILLTMLGQTAQGTVPLKYISERDVH